MLVSLRGPKGDRTGALAGPCYELLRSKGNWLAPSMSIYTPQLSAAAKNNCSNSSDYYVPVLSLANFKEVSISGKKKMLKSITLLAPPAFC